MTRTAAGRVPLLFLIADTGGGHRSAARAVAEALELAEPGAFDPVLYDPMGGPDSSWIAGRLSRIYGPAIRFAPWAWGALYHASDSHRAMRLLRHTLFRLLDRPVAEVVANLDPVAIVSFHPLIANAAVQATRRTGSSAPVVTVVTDLVTAHAAWRYDEVDRIVVPSAAIGRRLHRDGIAQDRCLEIGLPVASQYLGGPPTSDERARLRRDLGVSESGFLVVVVGGAEGSGGIAKQAATLIGRLDDIEVVAICGRNQRLQCRLAPLAIEAAGRLTIKGFVDNMSDWFRCADLVVTKAGPGTIAEATCCGAALVLTSQLPGQEKGNAELVVGAGAGCRARGVEALAREVGRLRCQPGALEAMRAASWLLSRPGAASEIAHMLAGLVEAVAATA